MKNILRIATLIVCIVVITSFNFIGVEASVKQNIEPCYIVTQNTSETFNINSSGLASMTAVDKNQVDEVKVTLNIKKTNGTNVYSKSYMASWSGLFSEYNLTKTYQLSNRGDYRFNVVYKCYKNNILVETITTDYIIDSY